MQRTKKKNFRGFLYILPSFTLILIFSVIPILMNIYFSFTKYNIIQTPEWIGLANYSRMIQDYYVKDSLKNTIVYTLITVPFQTIGALLIAAILAELFRNKFGNFVKSSLFVPTVASGILVGTLWFLFLAPRGVVNEVLNFFHFPSITWLGGKYSSMLSICMVNIWKNVGYFLVIYYAGIMDIPKNLYEAAKIDGANQIQCFKNITLPSLKNITYLVLTLGIIWSFQVFDLVYIMTGGGPGTSTITLVLTIYNAAFKEYNMGYASAIALLLFIFVLILNIIQKRFFKEEEC